MRRKVLQNGTEISLKSIMSSVCGEVAVVQIGKGTGSSLFREEYCKIFYHDNKKYFCVQGQKIGVESFEARLDIPL